MRRSVGIMARVKAYLAWRDAIGSSSQIKRMLRGFARFLEARAGGAPITASLTIEWVCSSPTAGAAGRARRLSVARGFLSYLRAYLPDTEMPGANLLAKVSRPRPYIYTELEANRLLEAALTLRPTRSLRPHTYAAAMGLMLSSGLRVGEVYRLSNSNVNLDVEPSEILVEHTKFRKSRIIPIHATTAEALRAYAKRRQRLIGAKRCDAFFVDERGRRLYHRLMWRAFNRARCRAHIRPHPDGSRPTLHSLRHTFAVNRMTAWLRQGVDLRVWLPRLSVYLGHLEPTNTYWYLTATPELLREGGRSFELRMERGEST